MRVVTAFCLACVCAELLVQLVEAGWARRCIKVVAGLYILTVLLRAISALPARTAQWLQPVQASASIEGVETTILTEAAKRLNEMLAAECEAQTGIPVRVETELEQTPDGIRAARAILWMPPDSPAQVQTQLVQLLQKNLAPTLSPQRKRRNHEKATITTVLQGCKGPQGRTRLAVLIGGVAMLLLLLSELMPTGTKSAAASTAPQEIAAYQTQLENRLETLIAQMDGAGKTTVMLTLETGEETIYALDTQSGQMQEQQTHVLLEDGSALAETIYQPQIRGVAVLCDGGGDVRVAARITEMVGALLDLPSNRICVEQRKP